MIPVIGTAVVGDLKWVTRLLASVDYPVDTFFIVNNSGSPYTKQSLDILVSKGHPMIENLVVTHLPNNLGVAGAWNLIIKCFMKAPYWLIVNDDVAFEKGLLQELYLKAENNTEVGLIHADAGLFNVGSWDLFLIKDFLIQEYGLFDENLYPAYTEDVDYYMRIISKDVTRILTCEHSYLHGEEKAGKYLDGAQSTKKSDPELATKLEYSNWLNFGYLNKKWGEGWRMCDPLPKPMSEKPPYEATYDLGFVRKKHLGF